MNSTGLSSTFLTTCSQNSHSDNVSQDELTWKDKCNRMTRGLALELQRISEADHVNNTCFAKSNPLLPLDVG
jgi:hypothetical protein